MSVLAPTWFPQPPVFPNFELPNTLTRLPANSSGPISERVGRSTWSGIQRRYQIYPLIAGQFQISARQVTVTYADPASREPIELDLALPVINFSSEVPPGAESLDPYIAGERFELRREVSGDSDGLSAGDAIEMTYQATLEGLPAMFLPDLFTDPQIPGLSVYAREPVIHDEDGRAVREEKLTLVFDGGGEFTRRGGGPLGQTSGYLCAKRSSRGHGQEAALWRPKPRSAPANTNTCTWGANARGYRDGKSER